MWALHSLELITDSSMSLYPQEVGDVSNRAGVPTYFDHPVVSPFSDCASLYNLNSTEHCFELFCSVLPPHRLYVKLQVTYTNEF